MNAGTTRRFRVAAILAPMIALGLGSFWLLEVMRRATEDMTPTPARTAPDFYVENFSYVQLAENGKTQYHFAGERLTHNPRDDSYDILHPVISSVDNAQAPMTLRSERAHLNSDNNRVQLYDNVQLDRPASANSEHLHVKTEYLMVLLDDDIMQTDKPVNITFGRSTLSGTGMFGNNALRQFRLMSNVHGTYQAPVR